LSVAFLNEKNTFSGAEIADQREASLAKFSELRISSGSSPSISQNHQLSILLIFHGGL
jgi:hypothetical protein